MAKKHKQNEVTEIDETIQASKSFFEKNKKVILYGGGAILAIIIACLLIHQFYIVPRNQKAQEALFKAEQIFQAGTYEKALNGDGENGGFLAVIDKFGSTKAGNLARLYAGICYYKDGKYQEATEMLQSFDDCGDEMVSHAVIGMLVSTLLKAAKEADNNTLSPVYLLQAGQIYESLQQNDKALDCYNQIKDKYQQSQAYTEVDKYIERLSK